MERIALKMAEQKDFLLISSVRTSSLPLKTITITTIIITINRIC